MNYSKIYNNLIDRAKQRNLTSKKEANNKIGYTESHHIIPRCMGGSDESSNLVLLTPEEHYVAHLLLAKIYPHIPGLIFACAFVRKGNKKTHSWLKRKNANLLKDKDRIKKVAESNNILPIELREELVIAKNNNIPFSKFLLYVLNFNKISYSALPLIYKREKDNFKNCEIDITDLLLKIESYQESGKIILEELNQFNKRKYNKSDKTQQNYESKNNLSNFWREFIVFCFRNGINGEDIVQILLENNQKVYGSLIYQIYNKNKHIEINTDYSYLIKDVQSKQLRLQKKYYNQFLNKSLITEDEFKLVTVFLKDSLDIKKLENYFSKINNKLKSQVLKKYFLKWGDFIFQQISQIEINSIRSQYSFLFE